MAFPLVSSRFFEKWSMIGHPFVFQRNFFLLVVGIWQQLMRVMIPLPEAMLHS